MVSISLLYLIDMNAPSTHNNSLVLYQLTVIYMVGWLE